MTLYDSISERIFGRIAVTRQEADCLEEHLAERDGFHVEIGCLWGATAILAALAKPSGRVISIDYMEDDYWIDGDPGVDRKRPTPAIVLDNLVRFGVAHRVSLVKAHSNPWPLPPYVWADTVFIDGDHSYDGCLMDWNNVRKMATGLVFFHDCDTGHSGVKRVVDEIGYVDRHWKRIEQVGGLAVFKAAA